METVSLLGRAYGLESEYVSKREGRLETVSLLGKMCRLEAELSKRGCRLETA